MTAAARLNEHLTWKKEKFSGQDENNNLVSWTSSFLYVVQYAIYKSQQGGASEVYICVVDTTKFPRGQFAHDKWLFDRLDRETDAPRPLKNIVRLRSGNEYNNGEYLSQGTVLLADRSCTFTLKDLKTSGLYSLYDELGDDKHAGQWAKPVKDLRNRWSVPRSITAAEISAASQITKKCFPTLPESDLILMLLTQKARTPIPSTSTRWIQELKPLEVRRFCDALNSPIWAAGCRLPTVERIRAFYECEGETA